MENIEVEFKEGALDFIVEKAVDYKLGARGLRSICEAIVIDAMFEMPSDKTADRLVIQSRLRGREIQQVALQQTEGSLGYFKSSNINLAVFQRRILCQGF